MSDDQVFVDTNIPVYAHDAKGRLKASIAKQKIKSLWERDLPPAH